MTTTATQITIETVNRRHYVRGNTYPLRDVLRSAGCKWDPDAKAWYTGKRETADRLLGVVAAAPEAAPAYTPQAGEAMVSVGGNTYPVRDQLRALGGSWDAAAKAWLVPASQRSAAEALVASAPKSKFARRGSFGGRRGGCRGCGGAIVSAPHHRAMGGYCGQCAFDEYDC